MSDIRFNQWLHNSGTGGVSQVDGGHVGIGTTNPEIAVHSGNNKILNVGIVTASTYYGDGSNLSGIQVGGASSLSFNDNIGVYFGNSQDLKIYHDGNHSYIDDQGTGNLRLRSGTLEILNLAGNKTSATFSSGGGQTLNFNNSAKFVTTNTGVVVTGIMTASSGSFIKNSNNYVVIGSSNAGGASLVLDGDSNGDGAGGDYSYIQHDSSGDLNIIANNPATNSNIVFYTGATEKVRITSTGRMGINETSPDSLLHVRNDNSYAAKIGGQGGGSEYYMEIGQLGSNSSAGFNATGAQGAMLFRLNGSEKMRIDKSGDIRLPQNVGIQTNDVTRENLVGAGSSLVGMYIGDGSILFNKTLNRTGGYYISTEVNALNAGPVTLDATMTLDGTWVIV